MKAAVVGSGAWGKNLVKTLYSIESLEAVVEVSPQLRETVKEQYPDVVVYEGIDQLISTDNRAVMIATPAPTHFSVAKNLLESGRDVFIEKPMTLSADESAELVDLADKLDRILMVGHLLIYQPAIKFLKESIDSGSIGSVKSIHQVRCGLGRARSVENVLWSLGVHDVAVAMYLVGETPVDIQVSGQRVLQPAIEDDVYLHMEFASGVRTHLHCSWLWPEKQRGLSIVGDKGMFVYNEIEQTVTLHHKSINSELKNVDEGSEVVFQGSGQPLTLEVQHFLSCVENRTRPISDGRSGLAVVKVLEQASGRLNK